MKNLFLGLGSVVLAIALLATGYSLKTSDGQSIGSTSYDQTNLSTLNVSGSTVLTGGAKVGTGTTVTNLLKGTCVLIGSPTIAATSTANMDCAVTGAKSGDTTFVTLPNNVPTTNLGWQIMGANASTTAGYITVALQNLTGAAALPPSSVTSSVQYQLIR